MNILRIAQMVVVLLVATAGCSTHTSGTSDASESASSSAPSPLDAMQDQAPQEETPTESQQPPCRVVRTLAADGHNHRLQAMRERCLQPVDGNNARAAIFAAAGSAQADTVELLLRWGLDPNVRDQRGLAPAFYAATVSEHSTSVRAARRLETIKALVKGGADIEITSKTGDTLLHVAGGSGLAEVVTYLLDHGSDPTTPNDDGATPIEVATNNGYPDIARLMSGRR